MEDLDTGKYFAVEENGILLVCTPEVQSYNGAAIEGMISVKS